MTNLVNKWIRLESGEDRFVTDVDQYGFYLSDGDGNEFFVSHSIGIKCQILHTNMESDVELIK